jgi:hypothetical protein
MSANDLAANHWTALAAQYQSLSLTPSKVPNNPEVVPTPETACSEVDQAES